MHRINLGIGRADELMEDVPGEVGGSSRQAAVDIDFKTGDASIGQIRKAVVIISHEFDFIELEFWKGRVTRQGEVCRIAESRLLEIGGENFSEAYVSS